MKRWISKDPPQYVWDGHFWYNEKDHCVYVADTEKLIWQNPDDESKSIPFPVKTKIMQSK